MTPLRHTWQVALRYIRAILRQPAWVGISLVQPMIWLLLFGALFKSTADIPGFTSNSYIEFLTPGVVVMLAISTAGWVGMGFIDDINRGTMDRLLVSPIWRGALNLGSVAQSVLTIVVQSLIVVGSRLRWVRTSRTELSASRSSSGSLRCSERSSLRSRTVSRCSRGSGRR
jgi:ABC-2 type transport system permease protein